MRSLELAACKLLKSTTCSALRCVNVPARTHPQRITPRLRAHMHANTHASARTTDVDSERHDVRSAGVADWKTVRGGDPERTLTA